MSKFKEALFGKAAIEGLQADGDYDFSQWAKANPPLRPVPHMVVPTAGLTEQLEQIIEKGRRGCTSAKIARQVVRHLKRVSSNG